MRSSRKRRVFARPVVGYSLALQKTPKILRKSKKQAKQPLQQHPNLLLPIEKAVKPPKEDYPISARRKRPPPVELFKPREPPYFIDRFSSLKRNAESGGCINQNCPICNKVLGENNVVILSCGHIVHNICLTSFGRASRLSRPKCPICHMAYKVVELKIDPERLEKSAIKIQKVIRGFLVRIHVDRYAPKGSSLIKRWIIKKAEKASIKLSSAMERQSDVVDAIISSIDHELEWARGIMKSVEVQSRNINWRSVRSQIYARDTWECTICLQSIQRKDCEITSCGHCFHRDCLNSWLDYCSRENIQQSCPECRSFFQHRKLREYHRPAQFADELDEVLFN
jgi:hypothetical protein